MSEIKKNIETCRGEDVLAEVSALPQDPHFGSLVNEALDPLKQQALHQAGYDGYSEVIEQHKPYTFASAIIQMKSNLLLLLRALWQFPFGSGTLRSLSDDASLRSLSDDASLRSLADMWQHYITRLSGNETYGIPSRLSSLTDLPSAPLLLADRKISEPNAIDGISLAQILCGTTETEEIYDNNSGWTMMRSLPTIPGLKKATIGCKSMPVNCGFTQAEEYVFPNLEALDNRASGWGGSTNVFGGENIKKIVLPALKTLHCNNMNGNGFFYSLTSPCEIIMENCEYVYSWAANSYPMTFRNCSGVTKLVFGKLTTATNLITAGFTNLIHLEIGQDTAISLDLSSWNPTNALDASLDTLVTDEDCHNNLEQFLKNFRTYIALRLATFDSNGPTLSLSQAVYDAIKDESHLFVFDEGTMTIYAYLTNIKHWTVTK